VTSDTPSKALHIVVPGDLATVTGGYEYARRMIDGLRRLGWTVEVLQLDASFPHPTRAALVDAERQLAALPDGSLTLIDGLALGAMPEIAHRQAQRLCLVALVHHPLALETGLSSALARQLHTSERQALAAVRHVIVTSPSTRKVLADYEVAPEHISIAEPGVDSVPPRLRQRTTEQMPLHLLCVATLTPRKDHALLLETLASLPFPWTLSCVGDATRHPETTQQLRDLIGTHQLQDRVVLHGKLSPAALDAQLDAADLFVLPTRFEGYGMAVAQALAAGLPVISTHTGSIPQLVGPDAGIIVPPGDADALRAALLAAFVPQRFNDLAAGAQRVSASLSDWSRASQRLANILAEVAARPSATVEPGVEP